MRVFAIIFTVIVCLGLISLGNVYGLPFVSSEYSYDTAKHVIVGRVLSVDFLNDPNSQYFDQKYREMAGLALYEIQVEEYMKNPMENPTIQVIGRYIDQKQTLYYESFPYEVNQRVLLYLVTSDIPQYDLMIEPRNSRVISEDFSAKQMLEDLKNKSAPLQQIKFGLSVNEIVCKNNLILIQKYDGSPACVTESTKQKLIERGWITTKGEPNTESLPTFDFDITTDNTKHGSQYQILGGKVDTITYDEQSNSLIITLNESKEGYFQIVIPSGLLHTSNREAPFVYSVMIDDEYAKFEKFSPILLKIPFEQGAKTIKISGISTIN